jgi:hypothetical protein
VGHGQKIHWRAKTKQQVLPAAHTSFMPASCGEISLCGRMQATGWCAMRLKRGVMALYLMILTIL